MFLCTVTNKKYIKNTINLIKSYEINSYNRGAYVYYFDGEIEDFQTIKHNTSCNIEFVRVEKIKNYSYDPTTFFYKTYAINDCSKKTDQFIYSDATNAFKNKIDIEKYLIDDSLFLTYNHPKLINSFWTTEKCFNKMKCNSAKEMFQYWAGFQVYQLTKENKEFIEEMYYWMCDEEAALPNTTIKKPDGFDKPCIEHRQDQSVLSLLINKYFRHQKFDINKQLLFGDWQTYAGFDPNYKHDLQKVCLSSRESKYGVFSFMDKL